MKCIKKIKFIRNIIYSLTVYSIETNKKRECFFNIAMNRVIKEVNVQNFCIIP